MPDRVEVRAAKNGARDFIEVPTAEESYLAALWDERRGKVARNDAQGIADVDAEIARVSRKDVPSCDGVDCKLMHPHAGAKVPRPKGGSRNGR